MAGADRRPPHVLGAEATAFCSRLNDVGEDREDDGMGAVCCAEPAASSLYMLVDGSLGDLKNLGNFPSRLSARYPLQHLPLALRKKGPRSQHAKPFWM